MSPEYSLHSAYLLLMIRLLTAHVAGDFIFQPKKWIEKRSLKKWKSMHLYMNAAVVAVLSWLMSGYFYIWYIPLLIFVMHAATDILKTYRPDTNRVFITDQVLHLLATGFATWLYFINGIPEISCCEWLFSSMEIWVYTFAYLIILWPMGIVIAKLTSQWQQEAQQESGLKDAGKYIGMLERLLILTFVFLNQFSAIGFLVAAKSILRFGDIKEGSNRKGAEYILLGTMISFAAAIFTGIVAKWLLNQ